jgi:hypothetical protein
MITLHDHVEELRAELRGCSREPIVDWTAVGRDRLVWSPVCAPA